MTIKIHPKVAQELLQRRGKSQATAMLAKARDAFEESKHKRDGGGRFTTGAGGGTAEHHEMQAAAHAEKHKSLGGNGNAWGPGGPTAKAHLLASKFHLLAAESLRHAEVASKQGIGQLASMHQREAQEHLGRAQIHEAETGPVQAAVAAMKELGKIPKDVPSAKPTAPDDEAIANRQKTAANLLASFKATGSAPQAKLDAAKINPAKIKRLAARQAALRESGSPRYSGNHKLLEAGGGSNSVTHHKDLKPGMGLFDKNGQKIDEVESIGRHYRAGERVIKTRAGYEKTTMGGHLPDGMYAKPAPTKVQWPGEKK